MRFSLTDITNEIRLRFATVVPGRMEQATFQTLAEVADVFKQRVRANIASGGMGTKWQNAFRVNVYPAKPNIDGAVYGWHNIAYSGIFETGGTITGKRGMLWIPFPNVPKVGRKRATPRQLAARGVKLFSLKRRGGVPILAARVRGASVSKVSVSLSQLRTPAKGRGKGDAGQTQPLFFGERSVTIRKRFQVQKIAEVIGKELPAIYAQNLIKGESRA